MTDSKAISLKTNSQVSETGVEERSSVHIGYPLKILIILFWVIQLWTSPYFKEENYSKYNYNQLFAKLDSLLQEDTLAGKRFALLEVIYLALLFFLIKDIGISRLNETFTKKIFYISLITVIICFLNPNNSFDEIKYLLSYEPRILIFYILMLFIFMSLKREGLVPVLYYFLIYGMAVAFSQAIVSTLLFVSGNGVKFLGSATTIPHSEIVNIMVIFSAVSLSLYLASHQKKYFLLATLFHITIFFADRRTPLAILIIIDLMLLFYYRKTGTKLFIKSIVTLGIFFIIFYVLSEKTAVDIDYFLLRIYAIVGGNIREYGDNFTDMGHWDQTVNTFATLFNNVDVIWGGGMRNYMFYVQGQSAYIHNSFAAVWAYYGIPMTLFLFYILIQFLKKTFTYLKESGRYYGHIILAPIAFSYFMILVGDSFTGEFFSKHFVYMALFVIVLTFMRLNGSSEEILYNKIIKKNYPVEK